MKKKIFSSCILLFPIFILAQTNLKGMIMNTQNSENKIGVAGATVNWLHTNIGAVTNKKGWFTIPYKKSYKKLVVSYVGYRTDTLTISNETAIHHFIVPWL